MAEQTTTIRIRVNAKKHLDQLSKSDRRSILDTLDLLLLDATAKSLGKNNVKT